MAFATLSNIVHLQLVTIVIGYQVTKNFPATLPTVVPEVGDICSETEPCIEGTICDSDGLCACPDPLHQVFDSITKKCVSKANQRCNTSQDCTAHAACMLRWNSSSGHFDGTCHCLSRYFELPFEGTCAKLAAYGEKCSSVPNDINYQPCDVSRQIQCANNTCQCSHSGYVYDEHLKICAIKAGDSCFSMRTNPQQMCVSGAKCRHHSPGESQSSKPKLKCRCEPGYVDNGSGFCQPSYGQSCSDSRPCYTGVNSTATETELICTGGKCQCSSPLYQHFDPRSNKCVNLVGSPCFQGQTICVPNAVCTLLIQGESSGQCECNEGYSMTSGGTCKLTFRMNCTTTEDTEDGNMCNHDAGLVCDDGKCNCFDNYLAFDKGKGMCVNRLGGFCGSWKDPKTGQKFTVGCAGSSETKCIQSYMSGQHNNLNSACFCSQDVKTLYPPKQYCNF